MTTAIAEESTAQSVDLKNDTAPSHDSQLSTEEEKELRNCEKRIAKGQRDSITAILTIRRKKLYRAQFETFDDYMKCRWGRSRQWATQQINWLRVVEFLDQQNCEFGKTPYQFSVDEGQHFVKLRNRLPTNLTDEDEQAMCDLIGKLTADALVEAQSEAEALGKPRTTGMTKNAVEKRLRFLTNRDVYGDDLTLDESVQIDRLEGYSDHDIRTLLESAREGAEKEERAAGDCLMELVDRIVKEDEKERRLQEIENDIQEFESKAEELKATKLSLVGAEDEADEDDDPAEDKEREVVSEDAEEDETTEEAVAMFDLRLDGDFVKVCGYAQDQVTAEGLAEHFEEFAVGVVEGRIKSGGIQIEVVESETEQEDPALVVKKPR